VEHARRPACFSYAPINANRTRCRLSGRLFSKNCRRVVVFYLLSRIDGIRISDRNRACGHPPHPSHLSSMFNGSSRHSLSLVRATKRISTAQVRSASRPAEFEQPRTGHPNRKTSVEQRCRRARRLPPALGHSIRHSRIASRSLMGMHD
jgi:hypothetical protein